MKLASGIVHVSFRRENFRISFLQPFLLIFLSALILSELVFTMSGNTNRFVLLVVLPTLVSFFCVTAVALLKLRCKIQVSRDGIDCFDLWSRSHRIRWDSIADVKLIRTAGLPYLKLALQGRTRGVSLPLFVSRPQVLKEVMTLYLESSDVPNGRLAELMESR